jgi:hypothetical protein
MTVNAGWGTSLKKCLADILMRCRETVEPTNIPGEGGERALKGWIAHPFLTEQLGWPIERIVQGERFDLRLNSAESLPVIYIETKSPGHIPSGKEREDFENRIASYGTLRSAVLTNGRSWERLSLTAPRGSVTIAHRYLLDLDRCSDEEIEAFFLPLKAERYIAGGYDTGRSRVSRANPHILASLAADLDQGVGDLSDYFERLFAAYEAGRAGGRVRNLTLDLFDHRCGKSLLVPLKTTVLAAKDALCKGAGPKELGEILENLGFASGPAGEAADAVFTLGRKQRTVETALQGKILGLYRRQIRTLSAQTAHVYLARLLVYRIGEDQGVFPGEISGSALQGLVTTGTAGIGLDRFPLMAHCSRIRERMETFLPSVFKLGEFDWWWVPPDKRAVLAPLERSALEDLEAEHEVILRRILGTLDGYFFGDVDVDVWRNVYQHYLPDEERQKLGGFYTPDELVDLVLDRCGYVSGNRELSRKTFIDPACGSGAFVAAALSRLLIHFSPGNPGYDLVAKGNAPEWKRAEAILRAVETNVHAIDIHPFAAFLTTINVMFLILPLYVKARKRNPSFSLELRIFSSDALEKPEADLLQGEMFEKLNSRIQLSSDALERYRKILGKRFDFVFGNPPWGGVLKGPLAPVFDETKKRRFRQQYPDAAVGKYDIYGLFLDRGLQILKERGWLGMVTQDTYLEKEWAASLRKKLSGTATVHEVIGLNPFGHLFFRAMNTPAVTVLQNVTPSAGGTCLALLSRHQGDWKTVPVNQRRAHVIGVIRKTLREAEEHGSAEVDFATACRIPLAALKEAGGNRWNLNPPPEIEVPARKGIFRVFDLFDPRQGVTPGGCLDIFLMDEARARELKLERKLVHRSVKSREFERWRTAHKGRVLLYPYVVKDGEAVPAFRRPGSGADALDFEEAYDDQEKEIRRGKALDKVVIEKILAHRIAMGIVKFPETARYLAGNYDLLSERVFKKRNIREFNRQWYEYLWPRDPKLALGAVPRIICPRLVKAVRFSLDCEGYLSDDGCQYLFPRDGSTSRFDGFRRDLSEALGREVLKDDAVLYCLAFLNSPHAQERLVSGRLPTPKGFYQVSEDFLKEICVALPVNRQSGERIIEIAKRLAGEKGYEKQKEDEGALFPLVLRTLMGS